MQLREYYTSELAFLRDTARLFAQENPALAGALQERGADPDVERLLEGVAFLTAGLRARIDQSGAQVVHGLAELLLPHYLRSLPATAIVEFAPNTKMLRTRQRIARDRPLVARPVAGTSCRFRTCFDVDLWPLAVAEARLDDLRAGAPLIRLELDLHESGRAALADPQPLRFFVHHADAALPAALIVWLTRHLAGVTVRCGERHAHLPASAVRLPSFTDSAVFPWPETAPKGLRSVLELFALPERFWFFELAGLQSVAGGEGKLAVQFEFERPPPLPAAIGPATFRLHCTPAINLFEAPAEPLVRGALTREGLVRADGVDPRHMEVHEVRSVTAVGRARGHRRTYVPFVKAAHLAGRGAPCFALRRAASPVDDGVDTYVTLFDAAEARADAEEEVVSLQLVCTNRTLPRELQLGDITEELQGGLYRGYASITPVSPPVRMALGSEALWRLLSHLALNQRGPVDAEALRKQLHLYNFHVAASAQRGRINERQIDAVRGVQHESVTRLIRGVPMRAVRTTVELDERGFAGTGGAYLFGAVLDALYGSLVTINTASELRVVLVPSQTEYTWPLRTGE